MGLAANKNSINNFQKLKQNVLKSIVLTTFETK